MKQFLYPFYTLLLLIFSVSPAASQAYQVKLQAPDYNSGMAYLIYYFGKSMNIQDSGTVNSKGEVIFQKEEKLLPGVYSIVFPGRNKLYDFLVDKEQAITIKADTSDLINKTIVTGSSENDLFVKYQQFTASMSPLLQKEINGYNSSKTAADSLLHQKKYVQLNGEMNAYRNNIIKEFPNSMLASLFLGMQEVTVPNLHPTTHKDTLENYQYYKKHFWDGITFMDDRIIRTPFFLPKLERYFRDVISPAPDSIIKESDYFLLLARSAPEMYKFLLNWFTDEYMNPKYMGQDAVLVHLFEKYHSKGISNWLNEKQLTAISNKAYMVMSNLIGEKAANLEMLNEKGKPTNLYSLNAKYTVVCFWDPTCSHCRIELPRMDSIYNAKWKQQGVQIFAVLTDVKEKEKWVEFINSHHLQNWTNVYETEQKSQEIVSQKKPSYKQLYNVSQTPTLYLLDKDKRIIAKQLTLEQIDEMLQTKIKNLEP
jgi:peroxiredoxin